MKLLQAKKCQQTNESNKKITNILSGKILYSKFNIHRYNFKNKIIEMTGVTIAFSLGSHETEIRPILWLVSSKQNSSREQ